MKHTYTAPVKLKSSTVHRLLESAGIVFDGVSIDSQDVIVHFDHEPNTSEHAQIQSLINGAIETMAREDAIKSVTEFATSTRFDIAGNPDYLEAASWTSKELRARRISSGQHSASDVAILQAEVDSRGFGETVEQLVSIQLAKADGLAIASSNIDGMVAKAYADLLVIPVETIPAYMSALSDSANNLIQTFTGA